MVNSGTDNFLTSKHKNLLTIAMVANLFAWIIFAVQILLIGARFIEVQNAFMISNIDFYQRPDFWTMLTVYPIYKAGFFVDLASIFFRGVVFWLGLKGIALGLYMIVETDLNYREKYPRVNHE